MAEEIINRIAQSNLRVFDLEDLWPADGTLVFDLSPLAPEGIIREADARAFFKDLDKAAWTNKVVAIDCQGLIIPQWLWPMAAHAMSSSLFLAEGSMPSVMAAYYCQALSQLDWETFAGKKVLLKGCSNQPVPPSAYIQATSHLTKVVSKLMYGEACSNVPIMRT